MSDAFDSPKLLIERAHEHIKNLEQEITAFFGRKPYTHVIDYDNQTRQDVYKLRLTAKLPGRLMAIAKDVCSNLRDALDHSVYASAVCLGNPSPTNTGFPFAKDAIGVNSELSSKRLKDVPSVIKPLLISFEPHETGNQLLVGLNRTRNTNTHRLLVPLGMASADSRMHFHGAVRGPSSIGYCDWNAAKTEIEFMRVGHGTRLQYNVNISFDVQIGDTPFLTGKPAVATFYALASEVEHIVLAIEAKS